MKYLRKFETEADVMMFVEPNVVLVADTESVMFNVEPPKGIFIQHIDGKLYTTDKWTAMGFANEDANGVAVLTDHGKWLLAAQSISSKAWGKQTLIEGASVASSVAEATDDLNGELNTAAIAAADSTSAAALCSAYVFPNGQIGYLPSVGEMQQINLNLSAINAALSAIGGTRIYTHASGTYWTSTQYDADKAYCYRGQSGSFSYYSKSATYILRVLTNLILN